MKQPAERSRYRSLRFSLLRMVILLAALTLIFWLTGCMERMFYYPVQEPTPVPAGFAGGEGVAFASADGTRLYGWFLPGRPTPGDAGKLPTILHAHGNAGNIGSHLYFTEFLPAAGFNLFIYDYRGYGQSEGSARRRNDLIADTDAALDAMLRREDVDPARIGLYAQSLGGAIALNVMAERREIQCAVIESPFTSWREMAASAVGGRRPGPIARLLAAVFIPDHRRPIDAIRGIDRPILILHGDADTIVPITHGRALAAAGPTAELRELEGGDHNTLRSTHPEVDRMMIAFFREHLAGPAEPDEPMSVEPEP